MNKKIFTLAAAFGLAASSFTAGADTPAPVKGPNPGGTIAFTVPATKARLANFVDGDFIYLNAGMTTKDGALAVGSELTLGGKYLTFNETGELTLNELAADPTYAQARSLVWKVKVIKPTDIDGASTYQFTHVASGRMLSIDPTTKISWTKVTAATAVEFKTAATEARAKYAATGGVSTWRWSDKGLYALKGNGTAKTDSVVYLGTGSVANSVAVYSMGYKAAAEGNYKDFETGTGIKENFAFTNDRQPGVIALTDKEINNLNGKTATQLQLFFNKNDVSTGKENIFTKYKLVADTLDAMNMQAAINTNGSSSASKYFYGLRAVGQTREGYKDRALTGNATWVTENDSYKTASEDLKEKIQKPLYIVMDTAYYSGTTSVTFALDTLDEAAKKAVNAANESNPIGGLVHSAVPQKFRALNSYLFKVSINPMNDSIVITTLANAVPKKQASADATTGSFWMTGGAAAVETTTHQLVVPELDGTKVVTMKDNNTGIAASSADPLIQPYKSGNSPVVGGDANFTDAQKKSVFFVKCKNESIQDGFDKFIVSVAGTVVYSAVTSTAQPSTQFVLVPGAGDNYFALTNRDGDTKIEGVWYKVADKAGVYTCGTDTVELVDAKVPFIGGDVYKDKTKDAYLGYFMASEKSMADKLFTVKSASALLANHYLNAKADSVLYMGEEETSFSLVKNGERTQFGPKVAGIDTLYKQSYLMKNKKDEYVVSSGSGYALSKKADAGRVIFTIVAIGSDSTFVLQDGGYKVGINLQTTVLEQRALSAANDLFSIKIEADPQSLQVDPEHVQIKALNGDLVAVGKDNFGVVGRVGDLKSAYEKDDFTFWLDTVDFKAVVPSYYVIKGIAEDSGSKKMFMYNTTDSMTSAKVKKEDYAYSGLARVMFREGERYGIDSLIVKNADQDTVSLKEATGILKGIENFRFQFTLADKNVNDQYVVTSNNKYLQNINGNLVMTTNKDNALTVTVGQTDAPVGNESIDAATIKVVAGEGNVTVYGAAGKKVVVSDVLGKNTTVIATSDSQVIPASQGVAIIAVEGEAAVKAVVK